MDTSFANIQFKSIWDIVAVALVFAIAQILVIIVKRVIEHKFSHEPTREDKIANDIFDKVRGSSYTLDEIGVKKKIAEFNLVREMLRTPYSEIKEELYKKWYPEKKA